MRWWEELDNLDYGGDMSWNVDRDPSITWDPTLGPGDPNQEVTSDETGMTTYGHVGGWSIDGSPTDKGPQDYDVTTKIPALFSQYEYGDEAARALQDYDWLSEKISGKKLTTRLSDLTSDYESGTLANILAMNQVANIEGKTGFAGSGGALKGREHITQKQALMGQSTSSKGKAEILSHILEVRKSREKYVDELWQSYTTFLNTNPAKKIYTTEEHAIQEEENTINPGLDYSYVDTGDGSNELDEIAPDSPFLGSGGDPDPNETDPLPDPGNCAEGTLWNGWRCEESGGTFN